MEKTNKIQNRKEEEREKYNLCKNFMTSKRKHPTFWIRAEMGEMSSEATCVINQAKENILLSCTSAFSRRFF